MQMSVRRAAVAALLVLACAVVLQAGDFSTLTVPAAPNSPALKAETPFGLAPGREFYITHNRWIPLGRSSLSVPILMYHYVRNVSATSWDRLGYNLSVTPANFQAQMGWLSSNGYHPINFDDLRNYFGGIKMLPEKPVVITLDDGYSDLYTTAFPILQLYKFKAVAYIVTSFVDRSSYVTQEQILEMDRHGIQIASHTVDHPNLARTSTYGINYQLAASKTWLERLLGHSVVDFAYPAGRFNYTVIGALQKNGYDTATTEAFGYAHSRADRYTWTRVRVGGGESLGDFIRYLGPVEPSVDLTTINSDTTERADSQSP